MRPKRTANRHIGKYCWYHSSHVQYQKNWIFTQQRCQLSLLMHSWKFVASCQFDFLYRDTVSHCHDDCTIYFVTSWCKRGIAQFPCWWSCFILPIVKYEFLHGRCTTLKCHKILGDFVTWPMWGAAPPDGKLVHFDDESLLTSQSRSQCISPQYWPIVSSRIDAENSTFWKRPIL